MRTYKDKNIATFISFPKSGWHRVNSKDITLFFHTNPVPEKDNPSHRHNDLTSFVLYYKGRPILIDIGRFNYNVNHSIGSYGCSAKAHNCITIDEFGPQAGITNRRLPDFYRSSKVTTDYSINSDQFVFKIEHSGFCRLFGDPIIHKRIFKLSSGSFSIEDELNGKKRHHIDTYFHWDSDLSLKKVEDGNFIVKDIINKQFKGVFQYENIKRHSENFQSRLFNDCPDGFGCYFPNYGLKKKITSLVFSQYEKLPIINKYSLEWKV